MDFFDGQPRGDEGTTGAQTPLAVRMRPRTLDEIVGQESAIGPGTLLRRAIEADRLVSVILYGPPGCGKTSLGEVVARLTHRRFERTSGVLANVATLRGLLETARHRRERGGAGTILFIDEIHHFNRSQQDILLPYVENGDVTLIGATTHNPYFFINSPLTSRSLVVELQPLSEEAIRVLLRRALTDPRGLAALPIEADAEALTVWARLCEGDARRALTALEIAARTTPPGPDGRIHLTAAVAEASIQKKAVVYDHDEDGHYDTISAFIKSVRGSDPDAALYWLAKMLYAGEDPRFIARRLIVLASEDIGNADPRGLTVAVAALHAVEFLGMPEARITLAQATAYLATAPKSNAAIVAIDKALADVKEGRVVPVPRPLRDAHYRGAAELGHTGYRYAHDFDGHFVPQVYLPADVVYYEPTDQGYEATIRRRLEEWRVALRRARLEAQSPRSGGGPADSPERGGS